MQMWVRWNGLTWELTKFDAATASQIKQLNNILSKDIFMLLQPSSKTFQEKAAIAIYFE